MQRTLCAAGIAFLASACGGSEDAAKNTLAPKAIEAPAATAAQDSLNRPPVIEAISLDPERPRPGEQVVARVTASDPDGDAVELSYRWMIAGRRVAETGPFLHVEAAGRDSLIEVTAVARDGKAESPPQRATARVGNQPPRVLQVVTSPLGEVPAGRDIKATPKGADADGDAIRYEFAWRVDGARISGDSPTLTSDHYERGDSIELTVIASDGLEQSEPLGSAPIKVVNAPPRITSLPGVLGEDGHFRYEVTAEDPDGDSSFRFRMLTGPEGMAIGFDDGRLHWEPGPNVAGSHPVEIEVADLFGARTTQTFRMELSYASEETPAAPADSGS